MIYVHDRGRMCNNILQYGHLYAWGREHGIKTMSMRFAYKYQYFHLCHTAYHHFLTYAIAKYAAKWKLIPTIDFDDPTTSFVEKEKKMLTRRSLMVTGWNVRFYDLFLKYKSEILELFAFDDAIEQHVADVFTKAADAKQKPLRLGVHIRRGDYARWQNGRFFFTDEQYLAIVKQFQNLFPQQQIEVYVCGNDPQLNGDYYRSVLGDAVHFPQGSPGEDLCLLSHCDYLIGPPSTFTLVAAMYRDLPLYWIKDAETALQETSFGHFDDLFQHIL